MPLGFRRSRSDRPSCSRRCCSRSARTRRRARTTHGALGDPPPRARRCGVCHSGSGGRARTGHPARAAAARDQLVLVVVLERPTALWVILLLALVGAAYATRVQAVALGPAILLAPLLLAISSYSSSCSNDPRRSG